MLAISAKRQFARLGKSALAVLMVAVLLLVESMSACPQLHRLIHHDADAPDHQCAATMFAHGQVDTASVAVPVVTSPALIGTILPFEIFPYRPVISDLPAGRGPPVFISNS